MTDLTDEVLHRVGRNLLLFQQIENALKVLLANAQFQGYANELDQVRDTRATRQLSQTLGQLVGQFTEEVLTDGEVRSQAPAEPRGAWVSFSFQLEADVAFYEQQQSELKVIVDHRNDLVHHFLVRWKPSVAGSTESALDYLDRQRQAALPMRDRLLTVVKDLQDGLQAHVAFLASEEGQEQLQVAWLQQSPLVRLLAEIAIEKRAANGWTPLATAGHLLHQRAPGDVARLLTHYGHRTLKGLVVAAELFDVRDEPTAKGGTRTVYQIKAALMAPPP